MPVHDWTRVEAGILHAFHHGWIWEISTALNEGLLPPTYYALPEQAVGAFGPDVLTLQGPEPVNGAAHAASETGGVATMAAPRATLRSSLDLGKVARRQKTATIRHVSDHRIVAIIEVVSPGNKATDADVASFCEKVVLALSRGVHVVVLDLLPPGPRDPNGIHGVLAQEGQDEPFTLPPGRDRLMASYRAGRPTEAFLEPAAVGEPLPDLPLFLRGGLHVPLPLEQTYRHAYRGVPALIRARLEQGGGA